MRRQGYRWGAGWRRWAGYGIALVAVALVSGLIGVVLGRASIPNISMLYLIAVLATAIAFGRGPAILASVAAFLTFNWFFVEPVHTFTVADPAEWVALLLFLLTAIVTGQLAARARQRALEAERREREAIILAAVVRALGEADLGAGLRAAAEHLRRELDLAAVRIAVADGDGGAADVTVGREGPGAPALVVPIALHDRQSGALTVARGPATPPFGPAEARFLAAVAAQLGQAVERARLRREATEAESLRRTDELKDALLNAVSHDLRTPLASIIASAGSLRQEDIAWTAGERREFAEAIEEEARRLNRIVGNLLDLSRLQGGSLRPERAWHDLGGVLTDALTRLRPLTARHHVVLDLPEELPPVPLDDVQIDQVFANLIENAAKYAPPDTKIWVSARRSGDEVIVQVADRGPGIPPAALPHLFDPFYRVERDRGRVAGTGVGLAVARGLVEAHGGRIWARNRADGGAFLAFTLPLAAPEGAADQAPAGRDAGRER